MNPVIHLENLSKTFGRGKRRVHAVIDNTLSVEPGQVFGFLGPNGAGKTTVIRMLLDLLRPTSGQVYLFGEPVRDNLPALRRTGSIIETPAFYPYMTGRQNLEFLARVHGIEDPLRIYAVLEQVGLTGKGFRAYGTYSLGMKQRLGLAAALLHDPDLLILDEPTNGLDPAGIQETRLLIRELVEQHGKTVFLSSHLLSEVEQACDRVAIISRGRIAREGTVQSLVAAQPLVRVDARPPERAKAALAGQWPVRQDNGALLVEAAPDAAPRLVRLLVEANCDVYAVAPQRQSLEETFLNITREDFDAAPTA
ncbi:MAG: ABC transporter ATP-binding protein [Chloroflexota bacterium]